MKIHKLEKTLLKKEAGVYLWSDIDFHPLPIHIISINI